MDTGRYFSQKEVINCTQLTRQQLITLENKSFIRPRRNPLRYSLIDVIYCRLVYRLREIYSFQQLKLIVLPAYTYGDGLLKKKYGLIKGLNQLELLDSLSKENVSKLEKSYYFCEVKQFKEKFTDQYVDIEYCYVDLEGIRVEVIDRAYISGVTSLREKFA
ncbi:MAG: hypothetical protein ACFBSE_14500 [Prochloraceae cyanobacterium]